MNNALNQVIKNQKISIDDEIYFEKIIDVMSQLFTNINGESQLMKGYKIDTETQLLFLNLDKDYNLEEKMNEGYYNWISADLNLINQFNSQKPLNKRLKEIEKLEQSSQKFVVFVQMNNKSKKDGYKFCGVFKYLKVVGQNCETIIYEKIANEYIYNFKNYIEV